MYGDFSRTGTISTFTFAINQLIEGYTHHVLTGNTPFRRDDLLCVNL